MKFFFFLALLFFKFSEAYKLSNSSIIILDNNIPEQCGVKIEISDNNKLFHVNVSLKKENNKVVTFFSVDSENQISTANITTNSVNLIKILKKKSKSKNFQIKNTTNQNATNIFFQELLINGAEIEINKNTYQVVGPIDSKVRLEYLFCSGEMFRQNR